MKLTIFYSAFLVSRNYFPVDFRAARNFREEYANIFKGEKKKKKKNTEPVSKKKKKILVGDIKVTFQLTEKSTWAAKNRR